jgi:hypothetical protein
LRKYLALCASHLYIGCLWLFLPLMPLLASLVFLRKRYALNYLETVRKLIVHIAALREGPARHYFGDVMGKAKDVPAQIRGHCVQCGNCCMDKRCVFLELAPGDKHLCGIYHSPFRRLSNCGSFPLNGHDIERYACPSYFAVETVPIRIVPYRGEQPALKLK